MGKVSEEHKEQLAKWRTEAKRLVQGVRIVPEPPSPAGIKAELEKQKISGDSKRNLDLVFYDVCVSGECITNPKTRKPPLRPHYAKMISGVLTFYGDEIPENVIFVVCNGGKEGVPSKYYFTLHTNLSALHTTLPMCDGVKVWAGMVELFHYSSHQSVCTSHHTNYL